MSQPALEPAANPPPSLPRRSRLRTWLLPPGSRRDRTAWLVMVTLRKMREGPLPWLRAVRLGLFQLLPPAAQERLLRLAGRAARRPALRIAARSPDEPGLVSVILPVYDQADLLVESVASVLAQTYRNLELIVIDDGSHDDVDGALRPFRADRRLRLLRQPNQGLPRALSSAFELARGEYWTWTSADNVMEPRQLDRLTGCLAARPEVAMVYADYVAIDAQGRPLVGGDFRPQNRASPDSAVIRLPRTTTTLNVVLDNFIGPCFLYRAWVGRLLGDYSPIQGLEDYDYWMRVNRHFRIEHLGSDETLYRYRCHDNTLSARARELRRLERGRELIEHERERASFDCAPLRIVASPECAGWARELLEPGETLAVAAPGELPAAAAGKTLLLLAGHELDRLRSRELPADTCLASVFGNDPAEPYRQATALERLGGACFAASPETAARLLLFSRQTFEAPPGARLLALARAFAGERLFQARTVPAEEARRAVPAAVHEPLRVLFVARQFVQGGLEQVVIDLALGLRARGHTVELAVFGAQGSDARRLVAAGVAVHDLSACRDAATFSRFLDAHPCDIVSDHDCLAFAEVMHARGLPLVQTIHNAYVWLDAERLHAYRAADAWTTAYAFVSPTAALYSDRRLGLDVGKAVLIRNGVEVPEAPRVVAASHPQRRELGLGAGDYVFLNVASLTPPKAQRIAVHALAALRTRVPQARIVFLGRAMDESYQRLVEAEAQSLGVADAVRFAGYHADPTPFYAMADAFLLPSYWEGCSLAALEAIAHGLPLVLSDVGDARAQIELGYGELVAPPIGCVTELDLGNIVRLVGDVQPAFVEALAGAMARLAETRPPRATPSPSRRWAMSRRRMTEQYVALFAWLRQGGHPRAAAAWLRRLRDTPPAVVE